MKKTDTQPIIESVELEKEDVITTRNLGGKLPGDLEHPWNTL